MANFSFIKFLFLLESLRFQSESTNFCPWKILKGTLRQPLYFSLVTYYRQTNRDYYMINDITILTNLGGRLTGDVKKTYLSKKKTKFLLMIFWVVFITICTFAPTKNIM